MKSLVPDPRPIGARLEMPRARPAWQQAQVGGRGIRRNRQQAQVAGEHAYLGGLEALTGREKAHLGPLFA